MQNKTWITFVLSLFFLTGFAQVKQPVKWKFSIKQKSEKEAEITATATIEEGWHIYTQKDYDAFTPTTFTFVPSGFYSLVGKTQQLSPLHTDEMWKNVSGITDAIAFEKNAVFKQKIRLLKPGKFTLKGEVLFGVCNTSECLTPENFPFEFELGAGAETTPNADDTGNTVNPALTPDTAAVTAATGEGVKPVAFRFISRRYNDRDYELVIRVAADSNWFYTTAKDATSPLSIKFELPKGVELKGDLVYPAANAKCKTLGSCYQLNNDLSQKFTVPGGDSMLMKNIRVIISFAASDGKNIYKSDKEISETVDMSSAVLTENATDSKSYWLIFLGAFISGFIALVMPCIFPMIPMTVSFFLKRSKTRKQGIANAMKYGLSIIAIYVTLGLVISAIFGSDSLNALATNIWFNLFFFAMLVVFALSFLGAFEITLPSKWVNAADRGADKGGFIGIFFMAFTLALVSFSCTGPIVGDLLVIASKQGGMGPFWGMFGFSLAIAMPFTLFAIFPSLLNSMPQSGGWLNTVKVSLGFLELALSFKFLSNADLVVQAHLLERETFIAIWIAIFGVWGLYLLGKFRLSHDSEITYLSTGRLTTALLVFSFTIYLIPGMWGAPLKWIAGFPPPPTYSEIPYGIGGKAPVDKKRNKMPEHAVFGPHQIMTFHDYDEAMEYAKEVKKPLLLDFTGYACVNCRKMEETVWGEGEVLPILKDSVILVSLYVDDKTALPESQHYLSPFDGKKITTIGQKWSDLQKTRYASNSQPQYFMLDHGETTLNGSANYQDHGTAVKFSKWLNTGIKQFMLFNGSKEIRPVLTRSL